VSASVLSSVVVNIYLPGHVYLNADFTVITSMLRFYVSSSSLFGYKVEVVFFLKCTELVFG
jgi:hypothetical protein